MELMNKFHDSINNVLLRLGKAEISLKEAQFEALKAIVMERKDSLVILPTGYGKSLIYQASWLGAYLDLGHYCKRDILYQHLTFASQFFSEYSLLQDRF